MDTRGPTASFGPSGHPSSDALHKLHLSAGSIVGPFRLIRFLGDGAFGVVYAAEPTEEGRAELPASVPGRVALKIIKPGMDSKAVVDRFEAERQALTMMHHAGIAAVYGGGLTAPEQGHRPYFAMELVDGMPISKCCDALRLTIHERCELLARVCDAVQHAHAKGIIHRDLKPSNVLITRDEAGQPQPKVIDFGIAKALNQRLTDATLVTEMGQLMGTPEYMSPEQADMTGAKIDSRSDVYSLGVMLYELVTSQLPFDKHELRTAGLAGIQNILVSRTPATPSLRLHECRKQRKRYAEILETRATQHRLVRKSLTSRLDAVVMKALAKSPADRYASPSDMADDLRRYLQGKRVKAKRPRAAATPTDDRKRSTSPLWIVKPMVVILMLGACTWLAFTQLNASAMLDRINGVNPMRESPEDDFGYTAPGSLDHLQPPTALAEHPPVTRTERPLSGATTNPASEPLTTEEFDQLGARLQASLHISSLTVTPDFASRKMTVSGVVLNASERQRTAGACEKFRRTHWPKILSTNVDVTVRPSQIKHAIEQWLASQGDRASTVRAFSNKLYIRRDSASHLTVEAMRAHALTYVSDPVLVEVD